MQYNNLHHYLDIHLSENANDKSIKEAKQAYWKWYKSNHRKARLKESKVLHLTISMELWDSLIDRSKSAQIRVYDYIKSQLLKQKVSVSCLNQVRIQVFILAELTKEFIQGQCLEKELFEQIDLVISLL